MLEELLPRFRKKQLQRVNKSDIICLAGRSAALFLEVWNISQTPTVTHSQTLEEELKADKDAPFKGSTASTTEHQSEIRWSSY